MIRTEGLAKSSMPTSRTIPFTYEQSTHPSLHRAFDQCAPGAHSIGVYLGSVYESMTYRSPDLVQLVHPQLSDLRMGLKLVCSPLTPASQWRDGRAARARSVTMDVPPLFDVRVVFLYLSGSLHLLWLLILLASALHESPAFRFFFLLRFERAMFFCARFNTRLL